ASSGRAAIVGAPVAGRAAGLFSVPGSCAPAPLLYGPTQSSGAAVAWVARLLGCRPADVPTIAARASAGLAASGGAGGSGSVGGSDGPDASGGAVGLPTFVPYLSGERAPLWNADVRGL